MKKAILIMLLMLPILGLAQDNPVMPENDWDTIANYLTNEEWTKANQMAEKFLKECPKDQINSNDAAALRYMFILSEAGRMNTNEVNQKEALKKVKRFIGLKVMMPGHPLSTKFGFNVIGCDSNSTDTLHVTESNKLMTQIFAFVYIIPQEKMTMAEFKQNAGQFYFTSGTLQSIVTEGHIFPRFKIFIDKAIMQKAEQ